MELEFVTIDVFTCTPYEGNPLAIIKVPAHLKARLSQGQKQAIAREFNLSETVFLHENLEGCAEWAVDIFTTEQELPFAGHPTIGSAFYVLNMGPEILDSGVLITKAGRIGIIINSGGRVAASISHHVRIHGRTIGDLAAPDIELSSNPQIAEAERRAPLVSIVKGMTFLLVKLPNLELLGESRCTGRHSNFHQLLDDGWAEGLVGRYFYVIEGEKTSSLRIRTRMIEATMEDPATGSAASALASYLALNGVGIKGEEIVGKYEITQGVEMGRKSMIGVEVEVRPDKRVVESVRLSGCAVKVMEGKLKV
jgi:PhzF family phenazine biosynthesis protein